MPLNIYDRLCVFDKTLDEIQVLLLAERDSIKHVRDSARLALKWRQELTGAINRLGIERDEVVAVILKIKKLKEEIFEQTIK